MQKRIALFLFLVFLLVPLSGCGGSSVAEQTADAGRKLSIVTTIFPEYDWVREIMGDRADDVEITLLLDNGADLHSYQPTAEDMVKISECDIFIYVGGESDEWVEDALQEAINKDMTVVNLLDVLGNAVKAEEAVEGMQEDDKHDHDHDHEEHEKAEYDEHVWLSLKNAAVLCQRIANQLGVIDPVSKDAYAANAAAYIDRLKALDAQYADAVSAAPIKTVLFGDRFPFRYLVDDYGLAYYAAFSGCSAETEASFETVVFLANKVDELGLPAVLTIESSDGKIAQTIVQNTAAQSAQILKMDSLQSTTVRDVEAGATYLGAMERNLAVLKEALG